MAAFQPYDTWVFLAVARSDGASLGGFLSAADHVNHALPTYEEVSESVGRLVQAGLVSATESSFRLTEAGQRVFVSVGGLSAAPIGQLVTADAALRVAKLPRGKVQPYPLSREFFDNCVRLYGTTAQ